MDLMKRFRRSLSVLVVSLLVTLPAFALDLDAAKSSGLIGETNLGYIAAVKPSADVDALVTSINSQRKAHYQEIATKNGITLEAVEVRAGQMTIQKTAPGEYINTGNGWEKK